MQYRNSFRYRYVFPVLSFILALSLVLSACQTAPQEGPATIKLALLPIIDSLPVLVAQQEGLFETNNVNVEVISVASAAERDQVITSGQADGMINEALSTMFYNKDNPQVQIVRFARAASAESPLFSILASTASGISSVDGLKGVEVGISEGTIIEYLLDRLLEREGFAEEEIQHIAVPKIPDRMNLLGNGQIDAAMLPEPAATAALGQGAVKVLDDSQHPELSLSTWAFRDEFIEQNPEALRNFLKALEEAVVKINEDPSKYSQLLVDQKILAPALVGSFQVPAFITAGVPAETHWADVLAWAKAKGLLTNDVSYSDSVTSQYLP